MFVGLNCKKKRSNIMETKNTNYKKSYNKDNYSRITVYLLKKEKEAVDEYCKINKITVAEFIKKLVYNEIGDFIKLKVDQSQEEPRRIEIYYIEPHTMLFTCGERWMISGPDGKGDKFGIKLSSSNIEKFKKMFSERKIDEKIYNRWEKTFSADSESFFTGSNYNGDIKALVNELKLIGDFCKVYDSFPTGG